MRYCCCAESDASIYLKLCAISTDVDEISRLVCTVAANSSEIWKTKGTTTILIYATLRHLLVLLILRKDYGIQHTVNKLVVSTTVKNYLSTADEVLMLCRF